MFAGRGLKHPMIIAYITDLFFQVKVQETARTLGADVRIVVSQEQLKTALEAGPSLLIVDLNAQDVNPVSLITDTKRDYPGLRVVAYLSHVQTDLFEDAKKAGAGEVLPRSQFSHRLAGLLK